MLFQNFGETKKRWILLTTTSYCTVTADSVQWLSQSDYMQHLHKYTSRILLMIIVDYIDWLVGGSCGFGFDENNGAGFSEKKEGVGDLHTPIHTHPPTPPPPPPTHTHTHLHK